MALLYASHYRKRREMLLRSQRSYRREKSTTHAVRKTSACIISAQVFLQG